MRTKGKHYQNNTRKYYKSIKRQIETDKFQGPAEILIYHAQKGHKAPEVAVDLTDKRVAILLDVALANGWPFIIHIEFASLYGDKRKLHMNDLKELLNKYPKHPFALIHMGQLQAKEARQLLSEHPNLHLMTSKSDTFTSKWGSRQAWINMFIGKKLKGDWKALMVDYPDRFVFALDNDWAERWQKGENRRRIGMWRNALAELPPTVAHAVAHGNAERLWNLKPKTAN